MKDQHKIISFIVLTILILGSCKKDKGGWMKYELLHSYPHNTSSFTQGLLWHQDKMYESTGLEGKSKILQVDYQTGVLRNETSVDASVFGEGICILNDILYQLTWQNGKVFLYNLHTMKITQTLPLQTEGWGATTDGQSIIVSDGTNTLYYYHPGDFALQKKIYVKENNVMVTRLNEIEYVDGKIYANQWQTSTIYIIDANTGKVEGKVNLSKLLDEAKSINPDADVLNGIAYNPNTKTFFVTGKLWPKLYEIRI